MNRILKIIGILILVVLVIVVVEILGIFRYDHVSPKISFYNEYDIIYTDPYLEATIYFLSVNGQRSQPYAIRVKDPNSQNFGTWPLQQFTWGPEGNSLAFRSKPFSSTGTPVILNGSGEFVKCRGKNIPTGKGRVWVVEENKVITPNQNGELHSIVTYDLDSCEIETVLYTAQSKNEILHEATISLDGTLAIGRYLENGAKKDILLVSPMGNLVTIPQGENPSWSKDGESLTYVIPGLGVFISNRYGDEFSLVSENPSVSSETTPSWSSDGTNIVYDAGINIYLVDLESNVTILLVENGISPNWR